MKSIFFLIITLFLISSLLTAQQSLAEETLDFENCNGVLSIDEVKNVIGDIENITVDSRGFIPVDGPSVNSACASTYEASGKTIGVNLVVMNSVDDAVALYKENLDSFSGQDFEIREYLTFWNNFDVVLNDQGVGSFMVSQYDKFFVNIHSNRDEGEKALADVEQIRMLSTIVQKKILDLDDVPISPPNPTPDLSDPDRFTPEHGEPPIETGELLAPLKQISQGIKPGDVKCNEGLVLITKNDGDSSACVKPTTAESLEKRGWGSIGPPCCKPTEVSSATNFEECVSEGNPIMESYPRKCRTVDGKQFVESIPENKKCEMSGGLWGIWGNAVDSGEQCNPSTTDQGIQCTDSSQCQSFCQAKEGSKISNKETGTCYGYELAICMQEVANGVVQPEWCQ
jgi:hypothetical protein